MSSKSTVLASMACPECGGQTRRLPRRDSSSVIAYGCRNKHVTGVDFRTHDLVSVSIPFTPLEVCPKCGTRGLKADSERSFDSEDGISKLVVYRCPNGHTTPQRQLVVRQHNLPDWDGEDYH